MISWRWRYGDGDGLYLLVRLPAKAFWLFRYTRSGRLREMGLGRARGPSSVTLAEARIKAGALHPAVRAGVDPLAEKDSAALATRAAIQQSAIVARTFRQAAEEFIARPESRVAEQHPRRSVADFFRDVCLPPLRRNSSG